MQCCVPIRSRLPTRVPPPYLWVCSKPGGWWSPPSCSPVGRPSPPCWAPPPTSGSAAGAAAPWRWPAPSGEELPGSVGISRLSGPEEPGPEGLQHQPNHTSTHNHILLCVIKVPFVTLGLCGSNVNEILYYISNKLNYCKGLVCYIYINVLLCQRIKLCHSLTPTDLHHWEVEVWDERWRFERGGWGLRWEVEVWG